MNFNSMMSSAYFGFTLLLLIACVVDCSESEVDGSFHFVLGGLFPIHDRGKRANEDCGRLLIDKGIQRLEAMFFALDMIEADERFANLSFETVIFDTCSSDSYALQQSLSFLKRSECYNDTSASKKAVAVIGAANSHVSEAVANILRLFKTPQVSYASTNEDFDNLHKFPYFFRVVHSDKFQIMVMMDLVRKLGWNYVSAVATEGEYGQNALNKLEGKMRQFSDICLATKQFLPRLPSEDDYENVVRTLLDHPEARAVIVFLDESKISELLRTSVKVRRAAHFEIDHFLWIGSDSWGTKLHLLKDIENVAEGTITISSTTRAAPGFDKYFRSLKLNNPRNRWFNEYWQKQFNCNIGDARNKEGMPQRACTGREKLGNLYRQEGHVAKVIDAVYVVAHALRDMCSDHPRSCQSWNYETDGVRLTEYISKVQFVGSQGHGMDVKFDQERNVPVNFTISQFRLVNSSTTLYDYVTIGEWSPKTKFQLWKSPLWGRNKAEPVSQCSSRCRPGYEQVRYHNQSCCWNCRPCSGNHYLPGENDQCKPCEAGYIPNDNHTACRWLDQEFMGSNMKSTWPLLPVLFSCSGILATILTGWVFTLYRQTPIIKASGRELCYIILVGVLLCYSFTFIAVAKPTVANCSFLRIGLGLGLSVCYSAIFIKTNRISRIFNRRLSTTKRPAHISPRSQVIIVCCLVAIQLTLTIMWLLVSKPDTKEHTIASPPARLLTCKMDQVSILLSLIYNMILVILCTVYAFKTRNIPENFNEAKFISFTMYSSCIVWLTFVAIFGRPRIDYIVQSTILCMSVSMSGTVVLVCLFFPKIYLVIFKPHKNVKYPTSTTQSATAADTISNIRYLRSGAVDIPRIALTQPSTTSSHDSYQLSPSPDLNLKSTDPSNT